MNTCVMYFPSGVNTCTRRLDRSATYTSPSLEILTACTGLLKVGEPGPSVSSAGGAGGPAGRGRRRRAVGRIAERAPHPLECAGFGVKHNHAAVAIAVGHERFVRFLVDEHVGRSVDVLLIRVALALTLRAELLQEDALRRELQQHVIGDAAPADPDDIFVVDGNPVLGERPVVSLTRAAPRVQEFAVGVEFENRGRRLRLQILRHRCRDDGESRRDRAGRR